MAIPDNFYVLHHFQQNTSCQSSILFHFSLLEKAPSSTRALLSSLIFIMHRIMKNIWFSLLIFRLKGEHARRLVISDDNDGDDDNGAL